MTSPLVWGTIWWQDGEWTGSEKDLRMGDQLKNRHGIGRNQHRNFKSELDNYRPQTIS